tara:strand:- start:449 stop:2620 length:2172 start_codon:yes stop_codon:yes gene_type:complete
MVKIYIDGKVVEDTNKDEDEKKVELPKVGTGADRPSSLWNVFRGSFAHDPNYKARFFANQRFGSPEAAKDRYFYDKKHDIYFRGADGNLYKEVEGDAAEFVKIIPELFPVIGAVAGEATLTRGMGLWGVPLGSGLGGMVGEGTRQTVAAHQTGQPYDLSRILTQGAEQGFWGSLPFAMYGGYRGLKGLANVGGKSTHLSKMFPTSYSDTLLLTKAEEEAGMQLVGRSLSLKGIDTESKKFVLTPAEISQNPHLLLKEKILRTHPATAEKWLGFDKKRYDLARHLIETHIANVHVQEAIVDWASEVGLRAKRYGKKFVSDIEEYRKERSTELYAFANKEGEGIKVNVQPVLDVIQEQIEGLPIAGKVFSKLNAAGKLFVKESTKKTRVKKQRGYQDKTTVEIGKTQYYDDMTTIHNIKIEINEMIADAMGKGQNNVAARLLSVKKKIDRVLESVSKTYKSANHFYHRQSQLIDSFKNGMSGLILKIDDKNAARFIKTLLNATYSPRTVEQIRRFFNKRNPKLWNQIAQSYLDGIWKEANTVYKTRSGINFINPAGYSAKIFGTAEKRAILKIALSPKQFKALDVLTDVLDATGPSYHVNSNTMPLGKAYDDMVDQYGSRIVQVVESVNPGSWGVKLQRLLQGKTFAKNLNKLSDFILDNQISIRELKEADRQRNIFKRRVIAMSILSKLGFFYAKKKNFFDVFESDKEENNTKMIQVPLGMLEN